MLIDIYARSMMTATRQPCVQVRDMPALPAARHDLPAAYVPPQQAPGVLDRLTRWFKGKAKRVYPGFNRLNQPVRCIDLQKL
ncbi:hypothetical protein [Pseudophaeobacter sp.]|uniref:hypothetical protein n=1 Tax=Pseudophaeobacter sp. TaxID=1971739 RepID=UPI003296E39D